jgi:hypothetical protein
MCCLYRPFLIVFFSALSLLGCSDSSNNSVTQNVNDAIVAEAEVAATEVIERHMVARNNIDAVAIADEDNYHQVRISNGRVEITTTAEEMIWGEENLTFPWLALTGWDHSTWDEIKIVQSSENKVHFALIFSRFDALGNKYLTTPTFWAVTNQDNHWGIKFRSSFVSDPSRSGDVAEAETAAIRVLERHLKARNDRDSESLAALNSYPLVFLTDIELNVFETIDDYILYEETVVIPDLDYSEWDHSEWEKLEVIQSTETTVHITVKLSQFDVMGKKYLTQDQFWVITNSDGDWKIQAQSNFVDAIQRS